MKNLLVIKTRKNGAFTYIDEPELIGKRKIASKNCCAGEFTKYINESLDVEKISSKDFVLINGINLFKHCIHII